MVKTGGAVLDLKKAPQPVSGRDVFIDKVGELLSSRPAAARRLIERYPDLALEAIVCPRTGDKGTPVCTAAAIQNVHGEQCGPPDPQLEALRLQANDLLAQNKPAEAVTILNQAVQAGTDHRYQVVQLLLVLSEAQRRAGKPDQAALTWKQAVEQASRLVQGEKPVPDPNFWDRAAYYRPVETPWPAEVARRLAGFPTEVQDAPPQDLRKADRIESLVWHGIGRMRLERQEAQTALVAFKRGESMTQDVAVRGRHQLGQARALLDLGQQAPAVAILVRLSGLPNGELAAPALALLGAVKLQGGSCEQALSLLKQALAKGPADWPGRGEAEADLGLACLTLGNEVHGLQWLHSAQRRFADGGDEAQLARCLHNESAYLEHKGRLVEADEVRDRATALGRNPQVLASGGR